MHQSQFLHPVTGGMTQRADEATKQLPFQNIFHLTNHKQNPQLLHFYCHQIRTKRKISTTKRPQYSIIYALSEYLNNYRKIITLGKYPTSENCELPYSQYPVLVFLLTAVGL